MGLAAASTRRGQLLDMLTVTGEGTQIPTTVGGVTYSLHGVPYQLGELQDSQHVALIL